MTEGSVGRQIAIAAIGEDERLLLDFLRDSADIQLFETFAPTREALWVEDFIPEFRGHWLYRAWNRSFPWTPEYGTVGKQAYDHPTVGWSYVSNYSYAPVLEISRTDPDDLKPGRLYWAGRSLSNPTPTYEMDAFERWLDIVFAWVRKNGKKMEKGAYTPYVFPKAAAAMDARRQNGPACAGPI